MICICSRVFQREMSSGDCPLTRVASPRQKSQKWSQITHIYRVKYSPFLNSLKKAYGGQIPATNLHTWNQGQIQDLNPDNNTLPLVLKIHSQRWIRFTLPSLCQLLYFNSRPKNSKHQSTNSQMNNQVASLEAKIHLLYSFGTL